MAIPRKVREQAEAANTQLTALRNQGEQGAKTGEDDADRSRQAGQGQEPNPQPSDGSDETWEQRFRVLQRKYDVEVPRQAEEIRLLKQQNRALTSELENLKQSFDEKGGDGDTGKGKGDEGGQDGLEFRSEDELRESLPDLVVDEIMALRQRISKDDKRGKQESAPQDAGNAAMDAQQQVFWKNFYRATRMSADELNGINSDPEFGRWMAAAHPEHEGKTRQDVITECQQDMDAVGCAQFYLDWKATRDAGQKHKKEDINPDTGGSTGELPGQGSPNYGDPSIAAKTDVAQLRNLADVKAWYAAAERAVRTGKMSRKDYEARDRAIFAAMKEGRFK